MIKVSWAKFLKNDSITNAIINADELAHKNNLTSHSAYLGLKRQERLGLVEHVSNKIYINKLANGFNPRDLLSVLHPNSYVSLDSALAEWGISTQVPIALTCISASSVRPIKTKSVNITFRKIKSGLFWGFTEKKTRYGSYRIAEPEKALLDWIYFQFEDGLQAEVDEFHTNDLSRSRLLEYAEQYPAKVRYKALYILATTEPSPSQSSTTSPSPPSWPSSSSSTPFPKLRRTIVLDH